MAVILPDRVLEKLRVVKAELVAEIEFTEWTPDGHPRDSKFCRVERRQKYSGRSTGKVKNQSKRPTVFPVQPGAIRSARWSPPGTPTRAAKSCTC